MISFEVVVPSSHEGEPAITMTIDAEHWMDAWRLAMEELGEPVADAAQATCRIGHDGSVEVITLEGERRVFVRSLMPPGGERSISESAITAPAGTSVVTAPPSSGEPARVHIRKTSGRPVTRRAPAPAPASQVPYARGLDGGAWTSAEEALEMLERHVRCEEIQFFVPAPDRKGWRLHAARGLDLRLQAGMVLREREPVPGAMEAGPGRRTFPGEGVTVRFAKGLGRKTAIEVKSALWSPIRSRGEVVGLILLLNARRRVGFTDPELSAVKELAQVLAARFESLGPDALL